MRKYSVEAGKVEVGFEFQTRTRGYKVERILVDGEGWAICELSKTKGVYAGNLILAQLKTKKGS